MLELILLESEQLRGFAGIDWLCGCGTKSATINRINDVESRNSHSYKVICFLAI
jgi:hypothetical protein